MASFISSLSDTFFDSAGPSATLAPQCQTKINGSFYLYSLIPAVLICLSFAVTKRRRNILLSVLDGRPGLLIPMDSLTRLSRISYACAFGATTNLVYKIIINGEGAFDYDGPRAVNTLLNIVSVVIYGLVFFPLFACLALGSAFGYGVGALYVWMLTAVEVYQLTECPQLPAEGRVILVFRNLPIVLCLLYLSLSIPARIVRAARAGRFLVGVGEPEDEGGPSLDDLRRAYIGRHVSKLLKKPEAEPAQSPAGGGVLAFVRSLGLRTFFRWRYRWRHGFRYPSRLLSVMFTGMLVVYASAVEILVLLIPLGRSIQEYETYVLHYRRCLTDLQSCGMTDISHAVNNATDFEKRVTAVEILRNTLVLSMILAFVITIVNVLHMITSFRRNLEDLYKGDHSYISGVTSSMNSRLCVGSIKYGGFQVAYIVAGFLAQFSVSWLVMVVFGFVVVEDPSVFLYLLNLFGPWAVIIVVLLIVQRLLAIFVFLQDRAAYLALDNRRCYFVFTYFMLFYNMFVGVASVLLRVLKSVVLGTLVLSRLDYSILPRQFQSLDPGYKAYLGYLQMEHAHTHPVLLLFVRLLLLGADCGKLRSTVHGDSAFLDLGAVAAHDGRGSHEPPRNSAVRRKWHVTYTLLRNPSLVYTRKVFNRSRMSRALAASVGGEVTPSTVPNSVACA